MHALRADEVCKPISRLAVKLHLPRRFLFAITISDKSNPLWVRALDLRYCRCEGLVGHGTYKTRHPIFLAPLWPEAFDLCPTSKDCLGSSRDNESSIQQAN